MYAVLAEDRSDADTLAVLIKRMCKRDNARVLKKGFSGCGELRRKASSHIVDFAAQGITHFIICHDSDGQNPIEIREKVRMSIEAKISLTNYTHKIIIPVQELEAWIIADEIAISKTIPSLRLSSVRLPEEIKNPKEWLIRASQAGRAKPLYAPATWNARVAMHMNIDLVKTKCQSFHELVEFIRSTL